MRQVLSLLVLAGVGLAPAALAADTVEASKKAKAGRFAQTAEVRCAQEVGQVLGHCEAGVARIGDAAAVVVTFPNGFARRLTFSQGAFLRGDATMSGVGTDTEWTLDAGLYRIRVDDQRFELPEALVWGD